MKKLPIGLIALSLFLVAGPVHATEKATDITQAEQTLSKVLCQTFSTNFTIEDYNADTDGSTINTAIEAGHLEREIGAGVFVGANAHVTHDSVITNNAGNFHDVCTSSTYRPGKDNYLDHQLTNVTYNSDGFFNYSLNVASTLMGGEYENPYEAESRNTDSMIVGDEVVFMGIGADGDSVEKKTAKITEFEGTTLILTDLEASDYTVDMVVFDTYGNFVGLPVRYGDSAYLYIETIVAISENAGTLLGQTLIVRDYTTLHKANNKLFIVEDSIYVNISELTDNSGTDLTTLGGQYDETKRDQSLINRMRGVILLQVNAHGEAWYVNPSDDTRYYMKNGIVAYDMMRLFGEGITDADLEGIPAAANTDEVKAATSVCATNSVANRLKGKILLQVEKQGQAWYVHPTSCHRIYMENGAEAYEIMRFLGEGIADTDLEKLPMSHETDLEKLKQD